jgi:hypothetical protein
MVTSVGVSNTNPSKKLINANVGIELGFALALNTDERLIMVLNTAFGVREELPFDLKHKSAERRPPFEKPPLKVYQATNFLAAVPPEAATETRTAPAPAGGAFMTPAIAMAAALAFCLQGRDLFCRLHFSR